MKKIIAALAFSLLSISNVQAFSLDDVINKSLEVLDESTKGGTQTPSLNNLSQTQIVSAFKDALSLGTNEVISQVGKTDGFNLDNRIRIPLPPEMQQVSSILDRVGLSVMTQDLETRLNRAAEQAAPQTADIFMNSIQNMSLSDAQAILEGPKDSATQYFRRTSSQELENLIRPIAEQTLSEVGALQLYDQFIGQYSTLPFVPDISANLVNHTTTKAIDGIFYYLAAQEADIRDNPSKWTTDVMKTVFGN